MAETIRYVIVVDNKRANKSMKTFKTNAVSAGGAVTSAWKKAGPVIAAAATAIAAAALIQGTKKIISVYGDFETQLANVSTLVDTNVVSMQKLKKEVLSLSPSLGSATKNTEALYQAISAGVAPEKAVGFVAESAKAAKAGLTDTLTAVEGGTTILNAFGMEASNIVQVFDKMFVAVKAGKTTFPELATSIGKVAPIAKSAGVSIDELLGGIAALTKQGVKTKEAVTALKAAFSNIIKPQGTAAKMAEELGLQFDITALKTKGLAGFLKDIEEKTGGDVEAMGKLFGSVEALNAILALTSEGGAKDFNQILTDMGNSAGETATAFEKQTKTYDHAVSTLKASMEKIAISIGSKIAPELAKAALAIADWLEASDDAEGSGLNTFITTATELWKTFSSIVKALSPVLSLVASAFKLINVALGAINVILTPVLALIEALLKVLAGGVSWLVSWTDNLGFVANAFKTLFGWIGDVLGIIPGFAKSKKHLDKFGKATDNATDAQRRLAKSIGTLDPDALKRAYKITDDWNDSIDGLRDNIDGFFGRSEKKASSLASKFDELKNALGLEGVKIPSWVNQEDEKSIEKFIEKLKELRKLSKKGLSVDLSQDTVGMQQTSKTQKKSSTLKLQLPEQSELVKVNSALQDMDNRLKNTRSEVFKFRDSLKKKIGTGAIEKPAAEKQFQLFKDQMLKDLRSFSADTLKYHKLEVPIGFEKKSWEEMGMFIDELREKKAQLTVQFKGEGSSVKPLSEKIAEMTGLIDEFGNKVDQAAPSLKVTFTDIAGDSLSTAMDATEQGFNDMFDSMMEGTLNVQDAFKDLAVNVLKSIAKMLASQAIKSFVGMLGGAIAGGFGSAPAMAGGGDVTGGKGYMVGERGPELFMPKKSGSITPNDKLGGGGSVNVVNNINVKSSGDDQADNKMANDIAKAIDEKVKAIISGQMRPGGILNPAKSVATG